MLIKQDFGCNQFHDSYDKYYKKGLATTVNFNSNQTFSSDINSISSVQQQDDRENLQEIEDDADKLIDLADVVDNE
ncbi:352_t:CDS:1, partial [Entrophospora sp. SA101]